MAWIESHEALEKHPKVLQLGVLMCFTLDETIGKLHRFWWWALNYAPTGELRHVDPLVIAYHLGIVGEPAKKLMPALMTSKLVCRQSNSKHPWRIHDWIEYAGRYLRDTKYRHSPDKYKKVVELYEQSCSCGVSRLSIDTIPVVGRQSAVPNLPDLPNQPTNPSGELKPSRQGRSVPVWEAYREAYRKRYGVDPVRNHKTNSLLCQVIDKLGADEAPKIAAFYVRSDRPLYVASRHAPDLLSRDAEGLRTEWAAGLVAVPIGPVSTCRAVNDTGRGSCGKETVPGGHYCPEHTERISKIREKVHA